MSLQHQISSCMVSENLLEAGGGGFHPDFFVKLDFEKAVYQQTKAPDQTFEGVPDSGCLPVLAGQPHPYLVNCWLNCAK